MKFTMYLFVLICVVLVGILAFIRLAPTDPTRWHQPISEINSQNMVGGAIRVVEVDEATFVRVDAAARALPRTQVVAGSVDEGRVTFVTRSKWIGFSRLYDHRIQRWSAENARQIAVWPFRFWRQQGTIGAVAGRCPRAMS